MLPHHPLIFPLPGGPSQIDHHNVDMANQLNRSEGADVRGVKDYQGPSSAAGATAPRRASKEEVNSGAFRGPGLLSQLGSGQGNPARPRPVSTRRDPAREISSTSWPDPRAGRVMVFKNPGKTTLETYVRSKERRI